ncbi:MAG: PQQ-dependent sugar dehydrogenase [Thauera sp.]|jgi:glucose/arabinose dehydrogenase|nr:PQQ-dependent sugar dehydrogenase [Thauera sp.]
MRESHRYLLACTLQLLCLKVLAGAALAADTASTGQTLYLQNCAICHGKSLEGVAGPSLIDPVWVHGSADQQVANSIRNGFPVQGMPAFRDTLDENAVAALVDYLRARRTAVAEQQAHLAAANPPSGPPQGVVRSEVEDFRVERIAHVEAPFGLALLPGGDMLITQTDGQLRQIVKGQLLPKAIAGTPLGNPGDLFRRKLMDVIAHPNYAANGWIYLASTDGAMEGSGDTRALWTLTRGRIRDGRWVDGKVIIQLPVDGTAGKMAFDRNGFLYITNAWSGYSYLGKPEEASAQKLDNSEGKVLRLHDDGRVPADNPFVNQPGAYPYIWSYGHRSALGIAFDGAGNLWATENGPRGGDELNLIKAGRNYGWPVITWGHRYDKRPESSNTEQEGMEQPIVSWVPAIAISSIAYYNGAAFPRWRNSLIAGSLKKRDLMRLKLDGERVVLQETLLPNMDRIRDVDVGEDGLVYLLTDSGDVLRLMPADAQQ